MPHKEKEGHTGEYQENAQTFEEDNERS